MISFKRIFGLVLGLFVAGIVLLIAMNIRADKPLAELKAKYATPASRFIPINGMPVHYRDEGPRQDSVPIVLLHGTGASLLTWNGWADTLTQHRRVIRLDLPAYGLTGPREDGPREDGPRQDTNAYSGAYYVTFLHNFLNRLGVTRCDMVGNSLGGMIAWRYALAYPAGVRRLVLIDAAGYPSQSASVPLAFRLARVPVLNQLLTYITPRSVIEQSLRNVYADPNRVTDALVDQYMDMALRAGNRRAFIARLQNQTLDSTYQQIPRINQRTLILWGKQDNLIPVSNARRFQQDLPNDTLLVMPGAGHVPMEELPRQSVLIAQPFLNQ